MIRFHLVSNLVLHMLMQFLLLGHCYADETLQKESSLNMGFYSPSIIDFASRKDVEVSLNFWVKDLLAEEAMKKLNIKLSSTKAILFESMHELHEAVVHGEIDMVVAPPLLISRYFQHNELTDGYVGMLESGDSDNLLLIVRNDKKINSMKDLLGKRLVISNDDELADMFIDTLFLKALNKGYRNSVGSVEIQNKGSRAVLDIYFNKADMGVVYRNAYDVMVELNPNISEKVIIFDKIPVKSRNFSYFVRGYPFVDVMTTLAITTLKNNVRAKQILDIFRMSTLEKSLVNELDYFKKYEDNYIELKKRVKQ